MKVFHTIALLTALLTQAATALGAGFKVSGRVADKSGQPEMYATVRVFTTADTVKPAAVLRHRHSRRVLARTPSRRKI